jgi:hypothetical protein
MGSVAGLAVWVALEDPELDPPDPDPPPDPGMVAEKDPVPGPD